MSQRERWVASGWLALSSPLIAFLVICVVALVASTSPQTLFQELQSPFMQQAIGVSLRTSLVAVAIVALFGTMLALAFQREIRFLSAAFELLVTIPAVMPPSVAGLALLLAFGRQGLLGPWLESLGITIAFTPVAVILAQVFVATPFYVREALNAFKVIDPDLVHAAHIDGASFLQVHRWITFPIALPFLITGLILAWTRALGEFGATMLFAGNLEGTTQTMPLAIYVGFESDMGHAKALAVLLLITAVLVLLVVRLALGRKFKFAH